MFSIEENLDKIRTRIKEASRRVGREPESVVIVAAVKEVSPQLIKEALACGVKVIGENRVQDAQKNRALIGDEAEWHMIGHLQTNKAKKALSIFSMIQSLDSLRLAEEMSEHAKKLGREVDVLVEVNVSGEATKFGVQPGEAVGFIERVAQLERLRVRGLFTIGIFSPNPEDSRTCFRTLRELRERIEGLGIGGVSMDYLSMGMTDDFEVAVEEGSNMVRIGRGIFGPRPA